MADSFDAYREALVIEQITHWSEELGDIEPAERVQLEAALHASAQEADELVYVRMHTGFRRELTVSEADLERVRTAAS